MEVNCIKTNVTKAVLCKSDEIKKSIESSTLAVHQVKQTGVSSFLSVIPLAEHDFTLNKDELHDAPLLGITKWYNKNLCELPFKCP